MLSRLKFEDRRVDFQYSVSPMYVIDAFHLRDNLTSIYSRDDPASLRASCLYESMTEDGALLAMQSSGYDCIFSTLLPQCKILKR